MLVLKRDEDNRGVGISNSSV